jgi:hypothetical protein
VAEPQWTVNGRAVPAGENAPVAPSGSDGAKVKAEPTIAAGSPRTTVSPDNEKPLDKLLADRTRFSAEEDAEIQRAMVSHNVDREHPVIQVVVEMILYRRQYSELLNKFEAVAKRVSEPVDKLQAAVRENSVQQKRPVSLVIQPSAAAAIYAIVLVAIAAVAWIVGQGVGMAESEARLRAAAPQVAALLTTRPGQAALGILRDNGDALPSIMSHCRTFVDNGRDAQSCTLWARGTGVPLTILTPLDHALQIAGAVPAWPFVIILVAGGVGILLWRSGRRSAVKAARGW